MKNNLSFTGAIKLITNPIAKRTKTGRTVVVKKIVVVEVDVDYPEAITFDVNEKLFPFVELDKVVTVSFNAKSWTYNNELHCMLNAWSIIPYTDDVRKATSINGKPFQFYDNSIIKEMEKRDRKLKKNKNGR